MASPGRPPASPGAGPPASPPLPGPDSDLVCPLCHELYFSPVATPCGHAFCSFCLGRLFETRRPEDAGVPLAERGRGCPMCRCAEVCRQPLRLGDLSPLPELDRRAQQAFPALHAQHGAEIEQERARLAARRVEHPRLFVGNLHALRAPLAGNNMHDWTYFVRMDSPEEEVRFIEQVAVHLHPTFRPSTVVLTQPPFAVRRLGWGYFLIQADVKLRPEWGGETLRVAWQLNFEGQGGMREIELELEHRPQKPAQAPSASPGGSPGAAAIGAATPGPAGVAGTAGLAGTAGAAGIAGAGAGAGHRLDLSRMASSGSEGGEEEDEEAEEEEAEEEEGAASEGDAGGDYDLRRFFFGGSPGESSGSEGDPTYDPGEGAGSDSEGGGGGGYL